MLTPRFLLRRTSASASNRKFLLWLAIGILVVFVFLRFFEWIDKTPRSLLPTTTSLILLEENADVEKLAQLPDETFGASIYVAGLYTHPFGDIPEGTVAVVYVKDDWRFVEIDELPGVTAQEYLATHIYPTQEVKLDQDHTIWIQTIDDHPRCIDYEDDIPNRCEISHQLIADLPERLLLIAADGTHATDGELIEMARSIVDAAFDE